MITLEEAYIIAKTLSELRKEYMQENLEEE